MGFLSSILGALPVVGPIASSIAGGQAQGRQAEDKQNIDRDHNAIDLYNNQMANARTMPNALTNQAMRGDIIRNLQDTHFNVPEKFHMPEMTGGLRPSLLGDGSRQAAGMMQQQALSRLHQFGQQGLPTAPVMSQASKPGWFERVMGGVGMAGNLAGAIPRGDGGQGGQDDATWQPWM